MSKILNWFKETHKTSTEYGVRRDAVRARHSQPQLIKTGKAVSSGGFRRDEKRVPPILVRGDLLGTQMVKKVKRNPRKKMRLPLQSRGIELTLPAIPTVHVGWRAFSAVIAGIMTVLLFILWTSPEYKVQAAQIQGLKQLDSQEVNSILAIEGKPIFELDRTTLIKILNEKFPELMDVKVEVSLPAEVLISVKERDAVMLWKQNERTTLIDKDGVGFPARKRESGLLVIYADQPPFIAFDDKAQQNQFLPKEAIQSILQLGKIIPNGIPLRYDKMHGLGWDDPAGWNVYFGSDFENIEQKILIYQAIVKHIQENGIVPTLISVEYLDAPYYHVE